ncbi:Uncharacterized conserved small protein [Legionella beliardensis]|uniref:Uncharacterized conserved small protein n=1 Tax=Legionella beliardensis TaxID=91822 RepID=A0A378JQW7_9GAMM|nr:XRE family transcriptional regulator [Legionella beliardensis]STX55577.1 Uncharacterized conserved small protein [Legionella beliardensis]
MNQYIGSSFDEFLDEEGLLTETSAEALKRVIVWQIKNYLEDHQITKQTFAKRMKTSRSQLDRLLDPTQTNISLKALISTAKAMGKHVEVRFTD